MFLVVTIVIVFGSTLEPTSVFKFNSGKLQVKASSPVSDSPIVLSCPQRQKSNTMQSIFKMLQLLAVCKSRYCQAPRHAISQQAYATGCKLFQQAYGSACMGNLVPCVTFGNLVSFSYIYNSTYIRDDKTIFDNCPAFKYLLLHIFLQETVLRNL